MCCNGVSQFKGLVPNRVEAALYGLGLLFTLAAGIWDQFEFHVGVWQTIGVHRNQIPGLFDWLEKGKKEVGKERERMRDRPKLFNRYETDFKIALAKIFV